MRAELVFIAQLLIAFQIKHLLCDFVFQNKWMVYGKSSSTGWVVPLVAHAGIHGLLTLNPCMVSAPTLWWLSLVDGFIHFIVDRLKASPDFGGQYQDPNPMSLFLFVLDQALHHFTNY